MDVCPSVGKRRESPSKNSRPILNLFSPKRNFFDGQCHGKSSLFPQEFVLPVTGLYCGRPVLTTKTFFIVMLNLALQRTEGVAIKFRVANGDSLGFEPKACLLLTLISSVWSRSLFASIEQREQTTILSKVIPSSSLVTR